MNSPRIVLVVEDQPLIRFNALNLVIEAGFQGLEAVNADEAIQILKAQPHISLVFTDIEMPGTMDGLTLANYIYARWPKMHLIIASGKVIVEQNQLPVGAKFFVKPYDDDRIVEEMKRMVTGPRDPSL